MSKQVVAEIRAIQDESGHWYVIPAELEQEFAEIQETLEDEYDQDLINEFEDKFDRYRTGGCLSLITLYRVFESEEKLNEWRH